MASLVLHIGMGKCGSSAIQGFLSANRETLARHNILGEGPNIERAGFYQQFATETERLLQLAGYLNEECRKSGTRKVVFSAEALSNIRAQYILTPFAEACASYFEKISIIVYLRRQDEWMQSAYQQWGVMHKTYSGPVKSFDEYYEMRRYQLDYLRILKQWKRAFENATIIVQPFEKQQLQPDLLSQFVRLAELPECSDYFFPKSRLNASFDYPIIEWLKHYNSSIEEPCVHEDLYRFLRTSLGDKALRKSGDDVAVISPKQQYDIYKEFESMNREIARRFLDREDGILFFAKAPNPDASWNKPNSLTLEALAPLVLDLLFSIHKRQDMIENRLKLLEKNRMDL